MTPAAYLATFAACVLCIVTARRARWRKVWVKSAGRGGRADSYYWAPPPHNGEEGYMTEENLETIKIRASALRGKVDRITSG